MFGLIDRYKVQTKQNYIATYNNNDLGNESKVFRVKFYQILLVFFYIVFYKQQVCCSFKLIKFRTLNNNSNKMCFSCKPKRVYHQMFNRMTQGPIKFDQTQIEQLKKKFDKVASYKNDIDKISFKKNMGILGLQSAFQFSDRLFNSFDIDNDGKISFHDFLQYMQVLKAGSQKHKARLSFKLIDVTNKNKFNRQDFIQFLNDFFKSWSSITNMTITPEIKQRTDLYVKMIFNKVKQDKGTDVIDFKYYSEKLYKDRQFLQAFEFITQGVASIFMSDRYPSKQNDHSYILWCVLRELKNLHQSIFDMSNEEVSFQFEDMVREGVSRYVPFAPGYLSKEARGEGLQRSRGDSATKKKGQEVRRHRKTLTGGLTPKVEKVSFFRCGFNDAQVTINESFHRQQVDSQQHSTTASRHCYLKPPPPLSSTTSFANQKKLLYIRTSIQKLLTDYSTIYSQLQQTYDRAQQQLYKKQKQKQTIKNVHKKSSPSSSSTEGNMVFFGDDNWNMVLNMMIGIQMAVRSVKGYQEMIYEQPRDFELKYYFELVPRRFGGEQYQSTIYSFTDYAPNTFNHIRRIFKIDNQEYIMSIGPNRLMASLMMGQVNTMTSLTSQGKSGSFFYYTADGKYMLKTIKYKQYKFLRAILKDYYSYIKTNPQTLITRFFGLHKLLEKNQKGEIIGRIYFVIMANVFNTNQKIVERYDIKGSWYGRENTDTDPNATKKDLDFLKRQPLRVSVSQRQKLMQIIKKDAQFFRQHQIIDYSLLIGVIHRNRGSSQIKDRMLLRSTQSLDKLRETLIYGEDQNDEKYIFGIIDILTQYDSKKVMQYYFKRTFYGEGISAVPPDDYAQRFVGFISTRVFPVEEQQNQRKSFFQLRQVK